MNPKEINLSSHKKYVCSEEISRYVHIMYLQAIYLYVQPGTLNQLQQLSGLLKLSNGQKRIYIGTPEMTTFQAAFFDATLVLLILEL